jgi:hypothetical protein
MFEKENLSQYHCDYGLVLITVLQPQVDPNDRRYSTPELLDKLSS